MDERVKSLYRLLQTLPHHEHTSPGSELPPNGIYFFFEKGEQIEIDGELRDRIVRVGSPGLLGLLGVYS